MLFQPLTTPRLVLRPLKETDDAAIFSLRSDESVNRFIDRPPSTRVEDARAFISKISSSIAEGKSCYWAITQKENDELIGTICIWNLSADGKKAELGYELLPSRQGKGIMTEAIKAVIEFAFNKAGLTTLEAYTHKDNHASTRLLQKHGFTPHPERKDPENENLLIFTRIRE